MGSGSFFALRAKNDPLNQDIRGLRRFVSIEHWLTT
jgi:hypothetical protein